MFIVMGATGHIGGAVADALLDRGMPVTVLTHRPGDADGWEDRGARVAAADVDDVGSLVAALRQGDRAFLLNPPADPAGDVDATETRTIANILAALREVRLEKVVAASTYGAQPGEALGDLSTLWGFEEGLQSQPIPAAINRGAYYMTNWLAFTDIVRDTGTLPSMFPEDAVLPMVAPRDLGLAAVERLLGPVDDVGIAHVEGPARYTPRDVAAAFAAALDRDVTVEVAPRERWEAVSRETGFSESSARSYARMTAATLDGDAVERSATRHGTIDLRQFIADAVRQTP